MVGHKERLSSGSGALAISLVPALGSKAVDLGPGQEGVLGSLDILRLATPGLQDRGLKSPAVAGNG